MKTVSKKIVLKGKKVHLAIVASRFNEDICEGLIRGAKEILDESPGVTYDVHRVPGAFELPLAAQKCALKKVSGVICLGAAIRGETPHFDYVCRAATDGILRVGLDSGIPVSFGLLTVDTLEQALSRSASDEFNKGREAALTVLEMFDLLQRI
ncbi:MAG: 6,7-dimethyl-8-ribityllumazine synthase [Deltaproteobacteria bacterium]|nr:6,7-dimethyl-8-ribityllumazine synthase [Deltaproteobacteria bacterium]